MKITFAILVMFSSDLFSGEQSLIKGTRRAFEHTNHRGSKTRQERQERLVMVSFTILVMFY